MRKGKHEGGPVCNTIGQEIRKIQEDSSQEAPIPTSFKTIDSVLGGLRPSQFIILGSRPGIGKSSFALTMARNIAVEKDIPTAYFSLEMPSEYLCRRLLYQESSITLRQAYGVEQWNSDEAKRVAEALSKSPLYIDDTPALGLDDFRIKAEKLVKENGVKVIIIDFVQLLTIPEGDWELDREEELRQIVSALKRTASELNVVIIGLSSLSKYFNSEQTNVPSLYNLYRLGLDLDFIKKNVDMIWLLYRPGIYGLTNDDSRAELIVAHNTHGISDIVIGMKFETGYTRFTDSQ